MYHTFSFPIIQLLKDLIDQHDIDIDSALEKARLQVLINKPKVTSHIDTARPEDAPVTPGSQEPSKDAVIISKDVRTSGKFVPSTKESDQANLPEVTITHCATTEELEQDTAEEITSNSHVECSPLGDPPATSNSSMGVTDEVTKACPSDKDDKGIVGNGRTSINSSNMGKSNILGNPGMVEPSQDKTRTSNEEVCRSMSSATSDAMKDKDDDAVREVQDVEGTETRTFPDVRNIKDDCNEESLIDERTDKLAVSLCRECRDPMPDPEPDEMFIYLHALTYKVSLTVGCADLSCAVNLIHYKYNLCWFFSSELNFLLYHIQVYYGLWRSSLFAFQ